MSIGRTATQLGIALALLFFVVSGASDECYQYADTCELHCNGWEYYCEETTKGKGQQWCCIHDSGKLAGKILAIIGFCAVIICLISCCVCIFAPCCPCYYRRNKADGAETSPAEVASPSSKSVAKSKAAAPAQPSPA